jgi:two-component system, OmpR family, response regulator
MASMNVMRPQSIDRLLVVDDDQDISEMLVEQLASAGYDVQSASSVGTARDVLSREQIDLIVLDLTLPDGDGLSLCRELRAQGHDALIVMVTARDAAPDRVTGLATGADDYIAKPFDPQELLLRIRNLLRRFRGEVRPRGVQFALFGPWQLDLIRQRLTGPDGGLVMLSTSEFDILSRAAKQADLARRPCS